MLGRKLIFPATVVGFTLVVGLFFFSGLSGGSKIGNQPAPVEAAADDDSCHPDNQYVNADDNLTTDPDLRGVPFLAYGSGSASFWESEYEDGNNSPSEFQGGEFIYSFRAFMDSSTFVDGDPYVGPLGGSLDVTVDWDSGPDLEFESVCILEVQSLMRNDHGGEIMIEVHAEGWITGFPDQGNDPIWGRGNFFITRVVLANDPDMIEPPFLAFVPDPVNQNLPQPGGQAPTRVPPTATVVTQPTAQPTAGTAAVGAIAPPNTGAANGYSLQSTENVRVRFSINLGPKCEELEGPDGDIELSMTAGILGETGDSEGDSDGLDGLQETGQATAMIVAPLSANGAWGFADGFEPECSPPA